MQEAAAAGVGVAGAVRVRVVQIVHVPAPVGGELRDGVQAVRDQPPQVLGDADAARVAAGHADDRDRLVDAGRRARCRRKPGPVPLGRSARRAGAGEARGRMVEDQGAAAAARWRRRPVAQLDRRQRVEAEVLERAVQVDGVVGAVGERAGHAVAH